MRSVGFLLRRGISSAVQDTHGFPRAVTKMSDFTRVHIKDILSESQLMKSTPHMFQVRPPPPSLLASLMTSLLI